MSAPTDADLQRAKAFCDYNCMSLADEPPVAKLIADVRTEERARGEAERARLAASLQHAELKLLDIYEGNEPNPIDTAEALAEEAEKKLESNLVEFADALGLINRFEGQAGYHRADVPEMIQRIEDMEHANDVRIEVEAKMRELVCEVRDWYDGKKSAALHDILAKYEVKP